jgi:hypothetical protein
MLAGDRLIAPSLDCAIDLLVQIFGAVTKSKRVTKLAVTKMGRAAASLGLFPLAADASISCAASLLCFTDVRRDKLLASLGHAASRRR